MAGQLRLDSRRLDTKIGCNFKGRHQGFHEFT